jgi:hypothetical protein
MVGERRLVVVHLSARLGLIVGATVETKKTISCQNMTISTHSYKNN